MLLRYRGQFIIEYKELSHFTEALKLGTVIKPETVESEQYTCKQLCDTPLALYPFKGNVI